MKDFLSRNIVGVLAAMAVALVVLVVFTIVLMSRLSTVETDLATTRQDLERVEAGAALFAGQVQGFQEQLADLAPAVESGLDEAVGGLASFRTSTIEFDVEID